MPGSTFCTGVFKSIAVMKRVLSLPDYSAAVNLRLDLNCYVPKLPGLNKNSQTGNINKFLSKQTNVICQ